MGDVPLIALWVLRTMELSLKSGDKSCGALWLAVAAGQFCPVRAGKQAPARPRASRAEKQLFTCLGEVSGSQADDGQMHFRTRIPGAVRTVQSSVWCR